MKKYLKCCESRKMCFAKCDAVKKKVSVLNLIFTAFLFSISSIIYGQTSIQGIAPVLYPAGGFAVDGDAISNYPQPGPYSNAGDWFSSPLYVGNGATIFNMETPDPFDLNYPMSKHWNDGWQHGTDLTVFARSNKINDPPNTYEWKAGNVPNKDDINNATVQFSWGDPEIAGGNAKDLWCSFFADRKVNNGESYIDFEFLQKPLVMTGTTSGSFQSSGTQGGRTVGDILITIEFQKGGRAAFAVIRRWEPKPGGGYAYVLFTPEVGDIYCTSNAYVTIAPWQPFGRSQYDVNEFAEGAVNLSKIFNLEDNPCIELSTVFVRTRTSGESTSSELKDFPGAPYQVNLNLSNLAVVCPPAINLLSCTSQSNVTTAYNSWVNGFSYTGGVIPVTDNIGNIPELPNDFGCTGGTLSFTYIAVDFCGLMDSCTSTFNVEAPDELEVTCSPAVDLDDCTSEAAITEAYNNWVSGFSFDGGCNTTSNIANIPELPEDVRCNGASLSFTYVATSDCGIESCTSTFNVDEPDALEVTCSPAVDLGDCLPMSDILSAYDNWKAGFSYSGGCNVIDNMADFPDMTIDSIQGGTLSFTYIVTSDCDRGVCSSEFTVEHCRGHIYPTQTTCCNYLTGTTELQNVCYTPSDGTVSNAIPGVFFYYTEIMAPSANFTIDVVQTKDCNDFKYFEVQQGDQILLFSDSCVRLNSAVPSESSTGQAHLVVTGANAHASYVLSVKYFVKSIIGSTYSGDAPTCVYHFNTFIDEVEAPSSDGHINVVPGCSDNTPLPENCSFNENNVTTSETEGTTLKIYPNPFTTSAEITFTMVNNEDKVVLEVVNLYGTKVAELYEGPANAGEPYNFTFNVGNNFGESVYLLVLRTKHVVKTQRLVVNR